MFRSRAEIAEATKQWRPKDGSRNNAASSVAGINLESTGFLASYFSFMLMAKDSKLFIQNIFKSIIEVLSA